jgi:type IV secretory pathway VirB10-like protein
MRNTKTFSSAPAARLAITAMLCAAPLFTFACGREAEEPRESDLSTTSAVEENRSAGETYPAPETPSGVEIREERGVDVPDEEVVAAGEAGAGGVDELEAHQRELDQKEAELEARARRLRDLERRQREIDVAEREIARRESQAAVKPERRSEPAEPARPARPEPTPEDDVDTEEVAEAPGAGGSSRGPAPEPEPAEEADEIARSREEAREEDDRRLEPATVPSGTVVAAEFLETLSSESSRVGDTFRARLTGDVRQGGRVVIPAGSEVVGEVTEAVPLRKVGGRAKLAVRFTDLILPHGVSVPIDASFVGQGKSETGRDAATIGGAAAGGAVLGRVINKRDRSRGAVIGAILGAAIGTAIASRTDGEEVNIFEGSVLDLRFDEPVEVPARR